MRLIRRAGSLMYMGFIRKKPHFAPPEPKLPLVGFVLLREKPTNLTGLAALVEGTLGVRVEIDEDDETDPSGILMVNVPDSMAFINVIDSPIPADEVAFQAARNLFWPDGVAQVATHRAQLLVTVMPAPDVEVDRAAILARANLFINLLAALCGMDTAIGVYIGAHSIVHEAEPFRELALAARADDCLAAPLLVHVMAAPQQDGRGAGYTQGLPVFGHDDIEIVDSAQSPEDIYNLLTNIVLYIVTGNSYLVPGETLGYNDEMRLPITLMDQARFSQGRTLRIEF